LDIDNQERNNSASSPSSSKSSRGKFIFGFIALALIISLIVNYNYSNSLTDLEKKIIDQSGKNSDAIKKLQDEISSLNSKYQKTQSSNDSMNLIIMGIMPYRPLIGILSFRDSMQRQLPFKVGSIVSLKPDSAIAVIKDILISGSDYEFSIQYRVITKSRNELLVTPALINKK
jgi:hypothetical protein